MKSIVVKARNVHIYYFAFLSVREGEEVARFMGRDVVLVIMVTVVIQVIAGPQGGQGVRPVGLPVVHSSCTQFIQYKGRHT